MAEARIDPARAWRWLMELAEITEPQEPWTRRAFTARHLAGRAWLTQRMHELGLATHVDAAGNLIGRAGGTSHPERSVVVGSHSDTVTRGGRFDGIAGVIAGLELAAALRGGDRALRHSLDVVDFLAEEPSEFGLSCIGSRGMAGALDADMLARCNSVGRTLREALIDYGAPLQDPRSAVRSDIAACFELHIEQGPVLEQERIALGIVTHIVGIRRLSVVFAGQAAHAGTTPLRLRQDALAAAAHLVLALRRALEEAHTDEGYVIATVGQMELIPNAANVIPGEARLTVDLRADQAPALAAWTDRVRTLADDAARAERVHLREVRLLSASEPTRCAPELAGLLRSAARELGLSQRDLVSGAGHDAAFIARVAPAAMLFVPSRAGLSHCAEEWTEPHELANGIAALLAAVQRFDTQTNPN
jgi:beta-ureidopropionase / N-carbamoyl-L-amino-acid hydrolase